MKNADTYVTVGKIGSSYGVHGWLKIHTYTEFGASILDYRPWYISANQGWHTLEVEQAKLHGNIVIAKFADIHTPEQARLKTGKLIAIKRSTLPRLNKGEYYWSDLQGLTVVDQHGKILGQVDYLIATGSNDVLIVKGDTEQAIPFILGKFITKVDLAEEEIIVDWEPI